MTQPPSLYKPALYTQSAGGIALQGGRCSCGYVFFPMQRYGCERCGQTGDALSPYALSGNGTLIAWVKVHVHADMRRAVPFIVATIALDDGPVIRTLLTDVPSPGVTRVSASLAPIQTDTASEMLDLRFVPVSGVA